MAADGASASAVPEVREPIGEPAGALAGRQVAVTVLRIGMGLMLAAAATDWLFAAIAGAGPATMLEGLFLTGCAVIGLLYPEATARLLLPTARVLVPALLFAVLGALDFGLQTHYAEVAPAIVWIAVIVSSPAWVVLCVAISALGYLGDLALQGHSLSWVLAGAGQSTVANQLVDLVANAAVVLLLVSVLRRFIALAPASIASVRSGGRSLTARLALAASAAPVGLLPRADPVELTATLSDAERRVLSLLEQGRAPKQVARDLTVALPTVRTHIASAKRKTGARTLEQLVAIFAEASIEW